MRLSTNNKFRLFLNVLALASGLFFAVTLIFQIRQLPRHSEIKGRFTPSGFVLLDHQGFVLEDFASAISKNSIRNFAWIRLHELPPTLKKILAANNFSTTQKTLQLLGLPKLNWFWNFQRELAFWLAWSQDERMEALLNLSLYRPNLRGLQAASHSLIDKPPKLLSLSESALLLASLQQPNQSLVDLGQPACALLRKARAESQCYLLDEAHLLALEKSFTIRPFMRVAPHAAATLHLHEDLRTLGIVQTTLDRQMQWQVLQGLQRVNSHDQRLDPISSGAAVLVENETGFVKAYVGGLARDEGVIPIDKVQEKRPIGPMLLPLLMAKALDEKVVTVRSRLQGVSLERALKHHMSLPTLELLDRLGFDHFAKLLEHAQISDMNVLSSLGPSVALGGLEVSLSEIVQAYHVLANHGVFSELRLQTQTPSTRAKVQLLSPESVWLTTRMLPTRASSKMGYLFYFSGTGLDTRSHWCVAFNSQHTLGISLISSRAQNRSDNPSRACAIAEALLTQFRTQPPGTSSVPKNLTRIGSDFFMKGTEPHQPALALPSRISFPLEASQIVFDPNDPRHKRQIVIQVVRPLEDQNLYLNQQRLGKATHRLNWDLRPGQFTLELRNARGQNVHRVSFAVIATVGP